MALSCFFIVIASYSSTQIKTPTWSCHTSFEAINTEFHHFDLRGDVIVFPSHETPNREDERKTTRQRSVLLLKTKQLRGHKLLTCWCKSFAQPVYRGGISA